MQIFTLFASLSPLPLLEVVDRGDGIDDDGAGTMFQWKILDFKFYKLMFLRAACEVVPP